MKRNNRLPPVHPGGIIKNDILPSVSLSVTAAAKALGVSRQMLHGVLAGRKPLSAVMCLKVSRLFGGARNYGCGCRSLRRDGAEQRARMAAA